MNHTLVDVFARPNSPHTRYYQYAKCSAMKSYIFVSVGPDMMDNFNDANWMCGMAMRYPMPYDSTNGTVSGGDVVRVSRESGGVLIPPMLWSATMP